MPRRVPKPPVPPRDRALACVRALVDTLYQSARAVEGRTGLTNAQLSILRVVGRHGPMSINDVAARVHAGQSTVSTVLARLGRKRLVRRAASRADGRRVVVEVTTSGRRALRHSPLPPTDRLLAALSDLPVSDAERLASSLDRLLKRMGRRTARERMLFG